MGEMRNIEESINKNFNAYTGNKFEDLIRKEAIMRISPFPISIERDAAMSGLKATRTSRTIRMDLNMDSSLMHAGMTIFLYTCKSLQY